MAAASEYLLANSVFHDTEKHAQTFARLITNANYRSIHTWRMEELLNRRKDMDYGAISSLPTELRVWIGEERARHIRHFQVEIATLEERAIPVVYNGGVWMTRFRKMFTQASSKLFSKQLWVSCNDLLKLTLPIEAK